MKSRVSLEHALIQPRHVAGSRGDRVRRFFAVIGNKTGFPCIMILRSTLPSPNIKCFILALIVLVFHTGAGWWTIFQLRVDIMSPAATRRLPQTFISCVCPEGLLDIICSVAPGS